MRTNATPRKLLAAAPRSDEYVHRRGIQMRSASFRLGSQFRRGPRASLSRSQVLRDEMEQTATAVTDLLRGERQKAAT